MKKETAMIRQKKQKVEERRKLVIQACEACNKEGVFITYKEIEIRTSIPRKTLERTPYKTDIKYYKDISTKEDIDNVQIKLLRDQIRYWKNVNKQMLKENKVLKTKLYEHGII